MQCCLRELQLFLAWHNIQLVVRQVSGSENWLADALSRFHTGDYSLLECSVTDHLLMLTIDWFASPSTFCLSFFAENSESLMDHSCRLQSFAFQESTKANIRIHFNSYLLFCDYFNFVQFPVSKQSFLSYLVFLLSRFHVIVFYWITLTFSSISTSFWVPTYFSCTTTMFFSPSVGYWYVMSWATQCVALTLLLLISFWMFLDILVCLVCYTFACMLLFYLPCFPFSIFLI